MMFYNNWIAFLNESYLFLGMCVAINSKHLVFDTPGGAFNSVLSLAVGGIIFIFPIFVAVFYTQRKLR
jgi:hypothetical protein